MLRLRIIILLVVITFSIKVFCEDSEEDISNDPRFSSIFDPNLKKNYARFVKHVKGDKSPLSEEEIESAVDKLFAKKSPLEEEEDYSAYESGLPEDLLGEDVSVFRRQSQMANSLVQQSFNGSDVGVKPPGEFVPWKKPRGQPGPAPTHPPTPPPTPGPTGSTETTEDPDPTPEEGANRRIMPKGRVRASRIYGNCGGGKKGGRTCFAFPDGCSATRTCRVAASITDDDDDPLWISVAMAASTAEGFVAIGFSEDRWMGNDVVVHCNRIAKSGAMTLHLAQNHGNYKSVMQNNMDSLRAIGGIAERNKILACEFNMSTTIRIDTEENSNDNFDPSSHPPQSSSIIDLRNGSYHVLLAFGRIDEKIPFNDSRYGALSYHHLAVVSKEKISLDKIWSDPQIIFPEGKTLMYLHIIVNVLAFSFFIPCAMFIAKYGREAYGQQLKWGLPLWLLIHLIFQLIAVVLGVVGLIVIVIEMEGEWRSDYSGDAAVHGVFGIFALALHWITVGLGGFGLSLRGREPRPDETGEGRKYFKFKWLHWYFGHCVYIFGMASLFVGPALPRARAPCLFQYIVGLQVLVHIISHVVMSYHTFWLGKELKKAELKNNIFCGPIVPYIQGDLQEWKRFKRFDLMEVWCGRRRAVIFYFITSGFCCIGLIFIMAVPWVICRRTSGY